MPEDALAEREETRVGANGNGGKAAVAPIPEDHSVIPSNGDVELGPTHMVRTRRQINVRGRDTE
jgi:hypothetical protein